MCCEEKRRGGLFSAIVIASFFTCLYRLVPGILNTLVIVKPETVIRWHRAGFRLFWRWKSRSRVGRPKVPLEIRQLIRNISLANPFWGAPRIHGEAHIWGSPSYNLSPSAYMGRAAASSPRPKIRLAEHPLPHPASNCPQQPREGKPPCGQRRACRFPAVCPQPRHAQA